MKQQSSPKGGGDGILKHMNIRFHRGFMQHTSRPMTTPPVYPRVTALPHAWLREALHACYLLFFLPTGVFVARQQIRLDCGESILFSTLEKERRSLGDVLLFSELLVTTSMPSGREGRYFPGE